MAEHVPLGPTEGHLVEELAGIIWRKRRHRLAEAALLRRRLAKTIDEPGFGRPNSSAAAALGSVGEAAPPGNEVVREALYGEPESAAQKARDLGAASAHADEALRVLRDERKNAYARALAVLDADTSAWWEETLDDCAGDSEPDYAAGADGLANWIEHELKPDLRRRLAALENRGVIREQALGDAFDPARLDQLTRYETHLDRKFERTLSMLVKLKELKENRKRDAGHASRALGGPT